MFEQMRQQTSIADKLNDANKRVTTQVGTTTLSENKDWRELHER